ncbi:MAG: hypothetical protein WA061_02515 [Microgenomates group bacterium]
MTGRISVWDDEGYEWYFRDGKIRMVLAEEEAETEEEREENGYYARDLLHGVEVLEEFGYISPDGFDEGDDDE